jgi:hypothetical protein
MSLDRNDRANRHTGKWATVEDIKLVGAVQRHGDKDWVAVAALVPGRTHIQCGVRWRSSLSHSVGPETGRTGKLTEGEVVN